MKIAKALVLLMVLLAGAAASAQAAADKIEWHTYDSGMARSRFEKKKVFLHFYADWCTYCAEMERKAFKDPAVIAVLNRNFIPIRVDTERDQQTASLYPGQGSARHMVHLRERRNHRPPSGLHLHRSTHGHPECGHDGCCRKVVPIQKWWISVQTKSAAISQPQA